MAEAGSMNSVNQHYLNKVMELTDVMPVHATEDIFDARGNKLLAKGALVSRGLQEKLIVHKLRKPIEASIAVEGGVDSAIIAEAAERVLDTSLAMQRVHDACMGRGSAMATLKALELGNAMSMMLTIAQRDGAHAIEHAATVSLLSICIAHKLGMGKDDAMVVGLAGVLHDIGELYIDPAYMQRGKRLLPHEYAHIVVHPHTGAMLIAELASWPASVARAVGEHHERLNGSGYPRRLKSTQMGMPGQILAVAEMLAGVFTKNAPMQRGDLALKLVPGEFNGAVVSAVCSALKAGPYAIAEHWAPGVDNEGPVRLGERIAGALEQCSTMLQAAAGRKNIQTNLLLALGRIHEIRRAYVATGLDAPLTMLGLADAGADSPVLFEREVATQELQWRLRDLARELSLHSPADNERLFLVPIINLLDGDYLP